MIKVKYYCPIEYCDYKIELEVEQGHEDDEWPICVDCEHAHRFDYDVLCEREK